MLVISRINMIAIATSVAAAGVATAARRTSRSFCIVSGVPCKQRALGCWWSGPREPKWLRTIIGRYFSYVFVRCLDSGSSSRTIGSQDGQAKTPCHTKPG